MSSASNNTPRPTIEELRRRARNRLIGAALLVIGAIVLFSFLFDSKPRPTTEEVDFSIPSESQVKPIGTADGQRSIEDLNSSSGMVQPFDDGADVVGGGAGSGAKTEVQGNASLNPDEEFVGSWEEETVAVGSTAAVKQETPQSRTNAVDEAVEKEKAKLEKEQQKAAEQAKKKAQALKDKKEKEEKEEKAKRAAAERKKKEEARVQAILSGEKQKAKEAAAAKAKKQAQKQAQKASETAEASGQYIVQFGSLKDPVRAEAVRAEVAAKGLTAYTQTADTAKGTYTRLRSGPYNSRAAANAAAEKIKAMGHPVLVKKR